jgi:Fe-S cluster biosynthesis and repair protein YggX
MLYAKKELSRETWKNIMNYQKMPITKNSINYSVSNKSELLKIQMKSN